MELSDFVLRNLSDKKQNLSLAKYVSEHQGDTTKDINVLFVCHANTCRSRMAEALMSGTIGYNFMSVGLNADDQCPMSVNSYLAVKELKNGNWHWRYSSPSKIINQEHIDWADIIIVMENEQLNYFENIKNHKTILSLSIPDPIGSSQYFHSYIAVNMEKRLKWVLLNKSASKNFVYKNKQIDWEIIDKKINVDITMLKNPVHFDLMMQKINDVIDDEYLSGSIMKLHMYSIWDGVNINAVSRSMLDKISYLTNREKIKIMKKICLNRYYVYYVSSSDPTQLYTKDNLVKFLSDIMTNNDIYKPYPTFKKDLSKYIRQNITSKINEGKIKYFMSKILWKTNNEKPVKNLFLGMSRPGMPAAFSRSPSLDFFDILYINQKLRYIHDIYGVERYIDIEYENDNPGVIDKEKLVWDSLCSQTYLHPEIKEKHCEFINLPVKDWTAPTVSQVKTFLEYILSCPPDELCPMPSIHCSAGWGRTGTFVLSALKCIYNTQNIDEAITKIRTQYKSMSENEIRSIIYEVEEEQQNWFVKYVNYLLASNKYTDWLKIETHKRWSEFLDWLSDGILSDPTCVELQQKYKKYGSQLIK